MEEMRSKNLIFWLLVVLLSVTGMTKADVLFESATLSGTGSTDLGLHISDNQSVGVRFYIEQDVQVTAIGGHLVQHKDNTGDFFGAILSLDSFNDYPSGNISTPIADMSEVVGSTIFVPDYPSSDYRTTLSVELEPGYYALIFGTNALGASGGSALMPLVGQTSLTDSGAMLGWQPLNTGEWHGSSFIEARFVVEGYVVPEPATFLLLGLGAVMLRRKR